MLGSFPISGAPLSSASAWLWQYILPASVVAAGGWTANGGISPTLTSTLRDPWTGNFDRSSAGPVNDVLEVALDAADPPIDLTQVWVDYTIKATDPIRTLDVSLVCTSTVIVTWSHAPLPYSNYATYSQQLTSTEASNVTNWADLRLRFTAN